MTTSPDSSSAVTPDVATEGDTDAQNAVRALDQVDVDVADDVPADPQPPEVLEGDDGGVDPTADQLVVDADDDPDDGLDDVTQVPDAPVGDDPAAQPDNLAPDEKVVDTTGGQA